MTSLRNNSLVSVDTEAAVLRAAREALLDLGWRNVTLTDVARRAGVSRMTVYRRWPDLDSLLGDLLTRQWQELLGAASPEQVSATPDGVANTVIVLIQAMREDPLFQRLLGAEPELVLLYLTERRGRSQELLTGAMTALIEHGQAAGAIRIGDPIALARGLVLQSHGFALSLQTMTGEGVDDADLFWVLRASIRALLAP